MAAEISESELRNILNEQYEHHKVYQLLQSAVDTYNKYHHGDAWLEKRLKAIKDSFFTALVTKVSRNRIRHFLDLADKKINKDFANLSGQDLYHYKPDINELEHIQERYERTAGQRHEAQQVSRPSAPDLYVGRNMYANPPLKREYGKRHGGKVKVNHFF
jgi:hypothetical protein